MGQHSKPGGNIIQDVKIMLTGVNTSKWYPTELRLVEAMVEIDGKLKQMTFITDNFSWAASSICDRSVEVFLRKSNRPCSLPISWDIMKMRYAGRYGQLC